MYVRRLRIGAGYEQQFGYEQFAQSECVASVREREKEKMRAL